MSANEIVQNWVEAFNRHDATAVASLYAPNAVVHDPQYAEPLEGRDAIREDMEAFIRAFPDARVEVEGPVHTAGASHALHVLFTATHLGPLPTPTGDIPPTGKPARLPAAGFYEVDGQGRILQERRYFDLAGLLAQLEVAV